MKEKAFILLICILCINSISAQIPVTQQIPSNQFPIPTDNQIQITLQLPPKGDAKTERNFKIELIPGKKEMVDCNVHGFDGKFEEKELQEYGYNYYVFESKGEMFSTLMSCPDETKHEEFVTGKSITIDYNSQIPLIMYIPKGFEVKYRIWEGNDVVFDMAKFAKSNHESNNMSLYDTWEWLSSFGGYAGMPINIEKLGFSDTYTFKEDGTYSHSKNGRKLPEGKFKTSNDVSIFIKGKMPMIQFDNSNKKMSYSFNGPDTLVLAEECYDCYKHVYVRKKSNPVSLKSDKIKDCPDMMIQNLMPQVVDKKRRPTPTSYYIYKGKRHEISEFDEDWIKKNCNVKIQKVY